MGVDDVGEGCVDREGGAAPSLAYLTLGATWSRDEPWILRLQLEAVPRVNVTIEEVRWIAFTKTEWSGVAEDPGSRTELGRATTALTEPWVWGRRLRTAGEVVTWEEAASAVAELRLAGDERVIRVECTVRPGSRPYRPPPFAPPRPPERPFEALPQDARRAILIAEQRYRDEEL